MLKIILNRLEPQAEKIIAEEETDFEAGRSTTEQIFNLRIVFKPSCKAQWKGVEKADRKTGGKTTLRHGQAWSSLSPRGWWRRKQKGGSWL